MDLRKFVSLVILVSFAALAVLSFLGSPLLSAVFIVGAGVVLLHHARTLCPECSNRGCAFNPRYCRGARLQDADPEAFSDLPITRTTVLPLLMTGPLAVIGAWLYSPWWTISVGAVALSAHFVFRKLTCKHCGNDCAGNCNPAYRAWRSSGRSV